MLLVPIKQKKIDWYLDLVPWYWYLDLVPWYWYLDLVPLYWYLDLVPWYWYLDLVAREAPYLELVTPTRSDFISYQVTGNSVSLASKTSPLNFDRFVTVCKISPKSPFKTMFNLAYITPESTSKSNMVYTLRHQPPSDMVQCATKSVVGGGPIDK